MPDRRTVYMTDDGTNTGLWKFIADRKNDLSSGGSFTANRHHVHGGKTHGIPSLLDAADFHAGTVHTASIRKTRNA